MKFRLLLPLLFLVTHVTALYENTWVLRKERIQSAQDTWPDKHPFLATAAFIGGIGITGYVGYKLYWKYQEYQDDQKTAKELAQEAIADLDIVTQYENVTKIATDLETATDHLARLGHKEAMKDEIISYRNYNSYPYLKYKWSLDTTLRTIKYHVWRLERRLAQLDENNVDSTTIMEAYEKIKDAEKLLLKTRSTIMELYEYKVEDRDWEFHNRIHHHYHYY